MRFKLQVKIKDEHKPPVFREGCAPGVLFEEVVHAPQFEAEFLTEDQKKHLNKEVQLFISRYIQASYEILDEDEEESK